MQLNGISFGITDWQQINATEHAGEVGVARWRTQQFGTVRVRLVECSAGYRADHWCQKGHILFCVAGELDTELADGRRFRLVPGMSFQVADDTEPHRSRTATGATLFIVDKAWVGRVGLGTSGGEPCGRSGRRPDRGGEVRIGVAERGPAVFDRGLSARRPTTPVPCLRASAAWSFAPGMCSTGVPSGVTVKLRRAKSAEKAPVESGGTIIVRKRSKRGHGYRHDLEGGGCRHGQAGVAAAVTRGLAIVIHTLPCPPSYATLNRYTLRLR